MLPYRKPLPKRPRKAQPIDDDERRKLLSTEQSLDMGTEPKIPTAIEGLETFSLSTDVEDTPKEPEIDVDNFFNLPDDADDDEDDDKQP